MLILDEPTVGQDPVLRDELWRQFRAMAAAGTTVLVSSHVMDEAGRCDRLLLIREGSLIADDTPDAIRAATGTDRPRRRVPAPHPGQGDGGHEPAASSPARPGGS